MRHLVISVLISLDQELSENVWFVWSKTSYSDTLANLYMRCVKVGAGERFSQGTFLKKYNTAFYNYPPTLIFLTFSLVGGMQLKPELWVDLRLAVATVRDLHHLRLHSDHHRQQGHSLQFRGTRAVVGVSLSKE